MTTPHDQSRCPARPRHRRGGSSWSIVVACAVIAILLVGGLWLAVRVGRRILSESHQETLALKQDLEHSVRQGMQEAQEESRQAAPGNAPAENAPVPGTGGEADAATASQWTAEVNEFLAAKVLGAGTTATPDVTTTSGGEGPGTPPTQGLTLRAALDRASLDLDAGSPKHPAVEAAIRTTLAASYLSLGLLDDAATHCERAVETLRTAFGEMHPYTLQARRNLGAIRIRQARLEDASILFQALYEMRLARTGPDDPVTLDTVRIVRILRQYAPNVAPGAAPTDFPPELRALVDDAPPACRFEPLEF